MLNVTAIDDKTFNEVKTIVELLIKKRPIFQGEDGHDALFLTVYLIMLDSSRTKAAELATAVLVACCEVCENRQILHDIYYAADTYLNGPTLWNMECSATKH